MIGYSYIYIYIISVSREFPWYPHKMPADNQTWLAVKSPNSAEAYSWVHHRTFNGGFSSKPPLITRG